MLKIKYFFISSLALCSLLFAFSPVLAQDYGLKDTANVAGITTEGSLQGKIGTITGALLSLVGVLFFLLALYGGILWMTARGEESQATKAKGIIVDAVIGLAIVSAAYIITSFVFTAVK
ncbi:MAG: hypothetical protein AAB568_03655 [Patescibacteria group bacterium]